MFSSQTIDLNELISFLEGQIKAKNIVNVIKTCTNLIDKNPSNFYLHFYLAISYQIKQDLPNFKKHLSYCQKIGIPNLLYLMRVAECYYSNGQIKAAQSLYIKGLQIADDNFEFAYNTATTFLDEKDYTNAKIYFLKSLSIRDCHEVNYKIGYIYYFLKKPELSIKHFNKAISQDAKNANAYSGLATAQEALGDFKNAEINYLKSLSLDNSRITTYQKLATIRPFKLSNKHDLELSKKIESLAISADEDLQKSGLFFSLGKIYFDFKDYKTSFEYYHKANTLKNHYSNFNQDELINIVNKTKFSIKSNIAKSTTRCDSKHIFIVGMPRSGSTVVEQTLSSHSQILGIGESPIIQNIIKSINKTDKNSNSINYPEYIDLLSGKEVDEITKKYNSISLDAPFNKKIIANKMLSNAFYIGFIKTLFPNSKIIHCKRHPLDTIASIYFTNFHSNSMNFAYKLENIILYYKKTEEIMSYWKELFPSEIHECYYEEMVTNQKDVTTSLIKFCGLNWEDNCLKFYKNKNAIYTASDHQAREKIYTSSINKWKNYEQDFISVKIAIENETNQYEEQISHII